MQTNELLNKNDTRIAIIGGGNIGTQCACMFSSRGYCVNVFSSMPEKFDGCIEIIDEYGKIIQSKLNIVTNDIGEAVTGCQVIIITYPAFRLKWIATKLLPYIDGKKYIGVFPGTGGAEYAFRECIKSGAVLFGLQRVPTVARLEKYGKRVRCEGLRNELFLASIPSEESSKISEFISDIWDIPCISLPNYLSVTLTPSNPILHTTRLYTMFKDFKKGKIYNRNPLFYGEWDDDSSELLISCDDELQKMIKKMDKMDLTNVKSLKCHYESDTANEMTEKICSIQSLHNLGSPMKKVEGGWIPDFESRYFLADFPYGLAIVEELANVIGYEVPHIKEIMQWYRRITGNMNQLELKQYGIEDLDDIYSFY